MCSGSPADVCLVALTEQELAAARAMAKRGQPARRFKDFHSRRSTAGAAGAASSPRRSGRRATAIRPFLVTSLKRAEAGARHLDQAIYCARGEMENTPQGTSARLTPIHLGPTMRDTSRACRSLRRPLRRSARCAASDLPKPSLRMPPAGLSGQFSKMSALSVSRRPPHQDRHGLGLPAPGAPRRAARRLADAAKACAHPSYTRSAAARAPADHLPTLTET